MNLLFQPPARRAAFTIIEVLIALAASLLLMLGLTRAFKLIGDAITASQSELSMASSLREVTFRMRDEMHGLTVSMTSPQSYRDGGGYFTYYEGPWTDATTTLVNGQTAPNYFPTSRYGDLDDYLAFTTRSEPGRPFTGTVPSGVIEAVRLADHVRQGASPASFRTLGGRTLAQYTLVMAHEPVTIYSEVAEVAYFLSPGWRRNARGIPFGAIPGGTDGPQFVDVINETGTAAAGDNIPDQLSLIRRLLLVRNDLNMTTGDLAKVNALLSGGAPPAVAADSAAVRLVPFLSGGSLVPLSSVPRYSPGPWPGGGGNSPDWLTGMARPHQWMDLSLSRSSSPTGAPTGVLKANSLTDLTLPENRFGFVRMPAGVIGGLDSEFTSSMGLLALTGPHPFITAAQAADVAIQTGTFASQTGGQVAGQPHPFSLVGFVRPEFSLADHWIPFGGGLDDAEPTFRGGSDVVATDVLSFDVQVLDPTAPVIIWRGPDGAFGRQPGADAPALIPAEADNVVIEPNNASFRTAIQNWNPDVFRIEARGGFVDHGYARLAGGTTGGLNPSRIPPALAPFFATRFSGKNLADNSFPPLWKASGRVVRFGATNGSFYQPTIDTWTDYYDHDGLVQKQVDRQDLDFLGSPTATGMAFRGWTTDTPISTGVGFVNVNPAVRESHPPTELMPAAVKVTIRIFDRSAGEVRQQSIIHHFRDRAR